MRKYLFILGTFFSVSTTFAQAPGLIEFFPTSGTTGTVVRINGWGYSTVTSVRFGGVAASSVATGIDTIEYIMATVGAGASGSVTVTTPGGTASKTGFTFTAPQGSPVISSFWPASATTGGTVQVRGANLHNVTGVSFGGTPAQSFSILSDTAFYINAVVGAGSSGSISVTNAAGTATSAGFTFNTPAGLPFIDSFWPPSAGKGSTVQIRGNRLNNVTAVSFGGTPAQSFSIRADTAFYIDAVVGQGSSGNISVTNGAGTAMKAGFTYKGGPVITSFTPTSNFIDSLVIIRGTGFTGATTVKFNGAAAAFSVDSSTRITATIPAAATSGTISVTTPDGTGVSSSNFAVNTSFTGVVSVCPGSNATLTSSHVGSTYRWQMQTDSGYVNLVANATYPGVNSRELHITTVPSSLSEKVFRCVINNSFVSNAIKLQITNAWNGSAGTAWENSSNWGCSQTVPDANTVVEIKSGSVLLSSNATVKSIAVAPGASFIVKPGFTLTVTGK